VESATRVSFLPKIIPRKNEKLLPAHVAVVYVIFCPNPTPPGCRRRRRNRKVSPKKPKGVVGELVAAATGELVAAAAREQMQHPFPRVERITSVHAGVGPPPATAVVGEQRRAAAGAAASPSSFAATL
jgi:hypothetical protein